MSDYGDEEYATLAYEPDADRRDDQYDDICRSCGFDDPCGCPMDINTMTLMRCPSCGGKWWREWGGTSTACLHRKCGADGSVIEREPLYAPHPQPETRLWVVHHRKGWCALPPGAEPDLRALYESTLCGMVILRGSRKHGQPDCPECLAVLNLNGGGTGEQGDGLRRA